MNDKSIKKMNIPNVFKANFSNYFTYMMRLDLVLVCVPEEN